MKNLKLKKWALASNAAWDIAAMIIEGAGAYEAYMVACVWRVFVAIEETGTDVIATIHSCLTLHVDSFDAADIGDVLWYIW